MAYRFLKKDRGVEAAVRRIAREQVDGALAAITAQDTDKATHEVRKACKKLRALLRLVRPGFADFARENAALRDLARALSGSRDAKVLLDTFDWLTAEVPEEEIQRLAAVRSALAAGQHARPDELLRGAEAELMAVRERIAGWVLEEHGWDALAPGLREAVRGGRKAARQAHREPTAERYHELRKLMKHHWYHTRLLAPLWPAVMRTRIAELGRLADLLGLHHDVSVFMDRLAGGFADEEAEVAIGALSTLAAARRADLERKIDPLAARLLAQKGGALAKQWHELWRIWRAGRMSAKG